MSINPSPTKVSTPIELNRVESDSSRRTVRQTVTRGELARAAEELAAWCRARDFAGHDPFDGLNSPLMRRTPLGSSRLARLVWTQAFKRSPINLRPFTRVPAERNAKGVALFVLAALARLRRARAAGEGELAREAEHEARALLDDLSARRIKNFGGAAWGYNFDWQSRSFFAPRGTPTVVPTAFAARAFLEAWRILHDERHIETARSACDFILRDLRRVVDREDELCFSYTPVDSSCVYNASLLAAETLAAVGAVRGERELIDTATRAARFVVRRQRGDGAWEYGAAGNQRWVDNFHTAYVLLSLRRIDVARGAIDDDIASAITRGTRFWLDNFFLADGHPKYFHDRLYPADAHSSASAIVALLELKHEVPDATRFAAHLAGWALDSLRDSGGFFYYQKHARHTVRTPYMRWTQAWILYALERLVEEVMSDES